MKASTYQLALHAWPPWDDAVVRVRKLVAFDPQWSKEQALAWMDANYATVLRPRVVAVLAGLKLPANLLEYFEDCVYADYIDDAGKPMLDRVRRTKSGKRTVPPLPFDVVYEWTESEMTHQWQVTMRVDIDAGFVTRDMLESVAAAAWESELQMRKTSQWVIMEPHPVATLALTVKPSRSKKKQRALQRFLAGEVDFRGLMTEELWSEEIQEEITKVNDRYAEQPKAREKRIGWIRKKVYDRVRRWLGE